MILAIAWRFFEKFRFSAPRLRRKVLSPAVLLLDHDGPVGGKVLFCQSVCILAEREQRKALQGLNFVDVDDMRWMDKNGQLAWTSGNWTQYASDLHKEVGNTLLMTITGRAQFNELVDSVSIIL